MKSLSYARCWCLFLLVPLLLLGCESSDGTGAQNGNGDTNGEVPDVANAVAEADGFAQKIVAH